MELKDKKGQQPLNGLTGNTRLLSESEIMDAHCIPDNESLRENNNFYRTLFDLAPDPTAITDYDNGRIINVNQAFVKWSRYSREELIGHTTLELGIWLDEKSRMTILNLLSEKGQADNVEVWLRIKNNELREVVFSGRLVETENRKWILSYSQDVTERKKADKKLRQAEEKYRSIFENAIEGIFQITPKGQYISVNPALAEMFGFGSPEDMLNYIPDTGQQVHTNTINDERLMKILSASGYIKGLEIETRRKDGTLFWISVNARSVRDAEGNLLYFEGTGIDITKRREAEKALRESEEQYRNLVEYTTDWVWEMDEKGKFIYSNMNLLDILGYKPEEIKGRTPFEFLVPEQSEQARRIFYEKKPFRHFQVTFNHRNGIEKTLDISGVSILDDRGSLIKYRCIARDITEFKNALERLRRSEEKFRRIAENSRDIIFRMSLPDGKYDYINPSVTEITGYSPEEFYKENLFIRTIIHPDSQSHFVKEWEELSQGKMRPAYEYKIIHKSGSERWLNQRNVLISDDNGQPVALEGIVTDITENRLAQEALRDEKEKLLAIINATTDRVYLIDTDGVILAINNAGALYSGMGTGKVVGTNIFDGLTHETIQKRKAIIRNICLSKQPFQIEYKHDEKWTDSHFFPVITKGEVTRIVVYGRDITDRKQHQEEREKLILELKEALSKVKTLSGMLPICASCKKIRNDKGYWEQIETYISLHSDAEFSHGICPECANKLFPDYYKKL